MARNRTKRTPPAAREPEVVKTEDPAIDFLKEDLRLDDLVPEFEKLVTDLTSALKRGDLPETVYHDRLAGERKRLVGRILEAYEESCRTGSRFYENLIYGVIRSNLDVNDGMMSAITRIYEDVRLLNNAHGTDMAEFDQKELEVLIEHFTKMSSMRTLMMGMGLGTYADDVLGRYIDKNFGTKPAKTVPFSPQRAVPAPVNVTMRAKKP